MNNKLLLLLVSLVGTASANSVSLSVVRSVAVTMSQSVFNIHVTAPASVPFTDITAGLRPAGIAAADLNGVSQTFTGIDSQTGQIIYANRWDFQITVPSAELSAAITRLNTALSAAQQASSGRMTIILSSAGQRPSPSDIAAARRTVLPEMWSELHSRAELLASAVGGNLSSLVSLTFSESSDSYFDPGYAGALIDFTISGVARSQALTTFVLGAEFADSGISPPMVTVSATSPDSSPVHVFVLLALTGPLSMTATQAAAPLQPLGITINDLTAAGLGAQPRTTSTGATQVGPPTESRWTFRLLVAENDLASTFSRIDQVARTVSTSGARLTYSVPAVTSQPDARNAATPRAWAAIVSECRSLSEEVARAAGREAGGFLGVTEPPSGNVTRVPFHLALRYELR